MAEPLQVHLSYATPGRVVLRTFAVAPGTTIGAAIEQCGVLREIPEIDLASQPVGIYGKKKPLETVLREQDRIEIYRPLIADPKESRRARADKKQSKA
jgi:putative ubiquitin-RnfH superfamily antitoxin RatB of RatAB toxin-antitoxin module